MKDLLIKKTIKIMNADSPINGVSDKFVGGVALLLGAGRLRNQDEKTSQSITKKG